MPLDKPKRPIMWDPSTLQASGSNATPYAPTGGTWGGTAGRLPKPSPYMMQDLQKQQYAMTARNTGSAQTLADTRNAVTNNRYSVGPYGALVAPNSMQNGQAQPLNPATGAPVAPGAPGVGGSSYSSSFMASGGGFGADDYKAKYNEAKAANEARYAEGKGELSGVRDRSMSALDNLSGQELADIEQRGKNRQASIRQNQTSLGLGGTTVGDTLAMGADRETSAEKRRAMDANAQQRIGTDIQTTGDLTGFIERRSDPYPDANPYIQLAMQQASQGVGGGGGYGGSGGYGTASTSSTGGGQRAFINNSQGYGPITPPQPSGNPAPTGVNLEYITGAAMNDPEYMKRLQNTPMQSAPKMIFDRQKYWM